MRALPTLNTVSLNDTWESLGGSVRHFIENGSSFLLASESSIDTSHGVALDLAVVFFVAIVVVRLVKYLKFLPKVTVYLIVGMVLGPPVPSIEVITIEDAQTMEVLRTMALAIILFLVGTEFRLEGLKGKLRQAAKVSFFSALLTFSLTALGCIGACMLSDNEQVQAAAIPLGVILGIFALEIGPASTLAVTREHSSHGTYTDSLKLLVGNDNLLSIFLFTIAMILFLGSGVGDNQIADSIGWALWPIPVGLGLGALLAWVETFEEKATYRLVMVLATLMAALGIAKQLEISWLLTVMIAGFAYSNSSIRGRPVVDTMRVLETPFYVIFFIYTGANIHLEEVEKLVATAPLVGIAYIGFRSIGKYFGTRYGVKKANMSKRMGHLLGLSVLAHSAVVLALLEVVKERSAPDDFVAATLWTLVLGSVLIFEILGPILVKVCVLKSGEVSIVDAVGSGDVASIFVRAKEVFVNLLRHLGIHGTPVAMDLSSLVINDRRALAASSAFSKVTKFIDHYPYDSFPVVNGKGFYMGFISFNEIKDASYDPLVNDLVRAADMVSTARGIDLDQDDIESAYEHLRGLTNTSLPVVRHDEDENLVFVGMILQRDLAAAHVSEAGTVQSERAKKNTSYYLSEDLK